MKKVIIILFGVAAAACTKQLTYNQAMEKNENLESAELKEDAEFLVEAKSLSMLIEQLAQIATEKGYSAEVQAFAEKILSEQTAINDRIERLASGNKIGVPAEISDDHRDKLEEVREATRTDFDKKFVNAVEETYEDSIELFEAEATAASTDEIRVFAAEILSQLRENEEEADEIEDSLL